MKSQRWLKMSDDVKDVLHVKELITNELQINEVPVIGANVVQSNGTENVTISNVGPAGIGTATISRWMQVTFNDIKYYIPMWT